MVKSLLNPRGSVKKMASERGGQVRGRPLPVGFAAHCLRRQPRGCLRTWNSEAMIPAMPAN